MADYYTKSLSLLSLVFSFLLAGCGDMEGDQCWRAFLLGLPDVVTTHKAPETATYYILKQTHEPLFELADGQNYYSKLLKKWSRDIAGECYTFCPDTSLKFTPEKYFDNKFFEGYLKSVTEKYAGDFGLHQASGCFNVKFKVPKKGYLDFLASYENAPSVFQTREIEAGLGPFFVEKMGKGSIVLRRKIAVRNGYNKIILTEYDPSRKEMYQYKGVADFNKIAAFDVPPGLAKDYLGFNNIELRSDVVMINHPDVEMRQLIYNCINVDRFRRAFLPMKNEFYSIKTILPVGVAGAIPGVPVQSCGVYNKFKNKGYVIKLFNHRAENHQQLETFASEFLKTTGVTMKIVNCTPKELVKVLHKYPRPFNLVVLGIDTVYPDYLTFFDSFVRPDGYFDFELPKIKQLYNTLLYEDDPAQKVSLAKTISAELSGAAVVLPLYQNLKKLYYPQRIKNLNVGQGFMEYPEVADFRW